MYEVRIHPANPKYGQTGDIFRVAKNSAVLDKFGQGIGMEYLGTDGKWYSEKSLKEKFKGGAPNPDFDDIGSRNTHIEKPKTCH